MTSVMAPDIEGNAPRIVPVDRPLYDAIAVRPRLYAQN